MQRLKTYASFVRFSHSVFALPFALTGALLALHKSADWTPGSVAWRTAWIVVAMVAARSAAMGFNRLADAPHDALNPRTSMRELPRGLMTRREALVFVAASSIVFVGAAWKLGPLCFALSPIALAIVFWYSLAKRFTSYTQLFLGLAMAVAPVGGWLAAGGRGGWEPWLLGLAIGTWVGGFDVLYACQDLDFDRAHPSASAWRDRSPSRAPCTSSRLPRWPRWGRSRIWVPSISPASSASRSSWRTNSPSSASTICLR